MLLYYNKIQHYGYILEINNLLFSGVTKILKNGGEGIKEIDII